MPSGLVRPQPLVPAGAGRYDGLMRALLAILCLLSAVAGQQRLPLDGTWQLRTGEPDAPGGAYDLAVEVPAAFETVLGANFDGVAWYRLPLSLRQDWRGRAIRVEFAAVASHATVY